MRQCFFEGQARRFPNAGSACSYRPINNVTKDFSNKKTARGLKYRPTHSIIDGTSGISLNMRL